MCGDISIFAIMLKYIYEYEGYPVFTWDKDAVKISKFLFSS